MWLLLNRYARARARAARRARRARRRAGDSRALQAAAARVRRPADRSRWLAWLRAGRHRALQPRGRARSSCDPAHARRERGLRRHPARAARSRTGWPCSPASSPRRRAPSGRATTRARSMLTMHVLDLVDEDAWIAHDQGPLRAAAAGDLRMSASLLSGSLVARAGPARAGDGVRGVAPAARAARAGPRAGARHPLRQRHAAAC